MRKTKVNASVCLTVMIGAWTMCAPDELCGAVDLAGIVANVRANEQRYADIDVTVTDEYVDSQPVLSDGHFLPVTRYAVEIHYVRQTGMFHLSVQGSAQRKNAKQETETVARDRMRLFDGTTSRALEGRNANLVDGLTLDSYMISPHMLILKPGGHPVPLSTYLGGDGPMRACRGFKWEGRIHIQTEYQGDEVVEGHPCHRVRIMHVIQPSGVHHSSWVLWLATDRNLIPIRCDGYTYWASKTTPVGRSVARDLREIAPGVWFPFEVINTAYNIDTVHRHNRQEVGWQARYTVKSVSLEPRYPRSFFSDLKIPAGTYVYHIDANGKIVRSHVQGAPEGKAGDCSHPGKPEK